MASVQKALVYDYVQRSAPAKLTTEGIAAATGVTSRSARLHCIDMVEEGIFERFETWPSHLYWLVRPNTELDTAVKVYREIGKMPPAQAPTLQRRRLPV